MLQTNSMILIFIFLIILTDVQNEENKKIIVHQFVIECGMYIHRLRVPLHVDNHYDPSHSSSILII